MMIIIIIMDINSHIIWTYYLILLGGDATDFHIKLNNHSLCCCGNVLWAIDFATNKQGFSKIIQWPRLRCLSLACNVSTQLTNIPIPVKWELDNKHYRHTHQLHHLWVLGINLAKIPPVPLQSEQHSSSLCPWAVTQNVAVDSFRLEALRGKARPPPSPSALRFSIIEHSLWFYSWIVGWGCLSG